MKAPSKATVSAFERFWKAYPYRAENPKAPARVVFERLLKEGVCPEALIAAAGRYADFVAGEKIKSVFIPHARKWLNQRYFEDYMPDPDAPASAQTVASGPSPDHPLAPLFDRIVVAAWASYIAPLSIKPHGSESHVAAPTRFALDRVRDTWGREIEARLGAVVWTVRR